MLRIPIARILALALPCLLQGCGLMLLSTDEEIQLGLQAYPQETEKYKVITSGSDAAMVQRVMRRLAPHAAPAVKSEFGHDFAWEAKLLDAPKTINAWCLPGGKIAFYTGILPICQGEAGVAVVMSHEIAHAVKRHGNQRISQNQIIGAILAGAAIVLDDDPKHAERNAAIMAGLGLGAQYGLMLPYSREHETEADAYGLELLIRSGYDPWEAVHLWERMAKLGGAPPEFLSTHPSPENRAKHLAALIPGLQQEFGKR